ncbi:hypothetical protein B0T17DRAFT_593821 [Bombardia bombarda]|uniref:NB-ARC domain-containing protein n=1 Tax=Bombardia bombarda TaxID=252184 RepID=A0AA39T0T3_9PEZI|nr:hypothetical protein B0T17DRAFT_593821 [Bombardia bombarda]
MGKELGSIFEEGIDILTSVLPPPIALIQPALRHLHVFVQFFETKIGIDLDASFLWGIIACLLQISADDQTMLEDVPRMVKALAHKAEVKNGYCGKPESIVNDMVKEACFDMQIQLLEFFTSSVNYVHNSGGKSEAPLKLIIRRFNMANQELGEAVTRVEKLAAVLSSPRSQLHPRSGSGRCLITPPNRMTRFFDRVNVFKDLDRILGLDVRGTPFRSVAVYGVGGVGKSSIVSTYMEARYKENVYDVCLWVKGEKPASLRQSFTDIAIRLKLPDAQAQNHDDNLALVQDWFQETESTWLVVYDNVESADILMPYWPISSKGRAIITTRNDSLAFEPASEGLEVKSWDDLTGSEFLLWLLKNNIGRDVATEHESALTLSQRLSGHALVISQMAGLIHKLKYSIQDFKTFYLKNPRVHHERDEFRAIWEISFNSLSDDERCLLGITSFLMPDNIPQEVFANDIERDLSGDLAFFADDFRDKNSRTLSLHRLFQTQFKYFLTPEQRLNAFNNTVSLVLDLFPDEDAKAGQLYDSWEACNRYLQHAINLRDCFLEEQKLSSQFQGSWKFCALLNRSQRFFIEINQPQECENTCNTNMLALSQLEAGPQKEDYKATITSHQAQIAESLGDADISVRLGEECYQIRLAEHPQKTRLLCFTASNLGYQCSSAGNQTVALEWFKKAREWWGGDPGYPSNIIMNEARCHVLLGDFKTGGGMLGYFAAQIKNADFSNWAMIAYGYFAIGVLHERQNDFESAEQYYLEAQNAWLDSEQTRLHPFNGACMYRTGAVCLKQAKIEAAIKHLRDSMQITGFHQNLQDRPVEHARNLFKLSEAQSQDDKVDSIDKANALREEAEVYLRKKDPDVVDCSTDEAYDRFVCIFWR